MTDRLHRLASSHEREDLELINDTAVYEAFAYNPHTGDEDIWCGTGTLEAINACGYTADLASVMYYPKELLINGWAFVVPR